MYILTNDQINEISGAGLEPVLLAIGAVAGTFKTAYETATWFGADQLGAWLGQGWYQANEICGSGVMALYGK